MVLLDSDMHQELSCTTPFMKAHIGSQLSSMCMLHHGYVYKFLFFDYDIHYKFLQGLGLVMFAMCFFLHSEIDEKLSCLGCSLPLMVASDIPSWLSCIMVMLFHEFY